MHTKRILFLLLTLLSCRLVPAQNRNTAALEGKILDENNTPLAHVSVMVAGRHESTETNDQGEFSLTVPSGRMITVQYVLVGYKTVKKVYQLNRNQRRQVSIGLKPEHGTLKDVKVKDERARRQTGMIEIDASKAHLNPSPVGGIEGLIKTYVGSNNELTSQYNVRGGNYDENLVYVNDYEIYRPFLVQNGQSEGLSFINADLTANVRFSMGGFQARYGDKMSSVLDITYKKPERNGGSAYIGLLEQGVHLEGISQNKKFTYLVGARNRTNQNLVNSQATSGNYVPSSSDVQGLLTYQFTPRWRVELFGNYGRTKFSFYPREQQLTTSVISPLFSADYAVHFDFEGSEKDKYATNFAGLTAVQQATKSVQLKWMLSHYGDDETQNTDIAGDYIFGSPDQSNNGEITNPLGAGSNINYSRNALKINIWTAQHRGTWRVQKHFLQWGILAERQTVDSRINQWTYIDSAGYSLPDNPGGDLQLSDVMSGNAHFSLTRTTGFIQDNINLGDSAGLTLQPGVRYNYNTLNKQWLISPRLNISYKPTHWEKDFIFRAAVGIYDQAPFYREMLRYDGSINMDLKAQKSWQASGGFDYQFKMVSRPARFTTELYYKSMRDVVPYDIDNVRIRYWGDNRAKAYARGIEMRLFGELVKDAESWVSLGIMDTKEKIDGLTYTQYYNGAGETITSQSKDKNVVDSSVSPVGWLRRPTDRRVTLGMFFQDYLSTNKNCRVYVNTVFGSNLPYNIPGSTRYRNALQIDPYMRMDIGFSMMLLDGSKMQRSYSPFKNFKNIWASVEVFNLLDRSNIISYTLIKDFANNTYTMPNRLTPRLLNFKVVASW